ncbi:MAG: CHRD domain-containing protein [Planctomycetes bacterium]|nr:CHRD domain-containing protein [Planctomycetota bacterium]
MFAIISVVVRLFVTRTISLVLLSFSLIAVLGCWESRPGPGDVQKMAQYELQNTSQFSCNGREVVPPIPVSSVGRGRCSKGDNGFTISVGAESLSSSVTAVHIHRATKGKNGTVIFDMLSKYVVSETSTSRPFVISRWQPSSSELTALKAGEVYVDIHTAHFPQGEIRGQITPAPGW